MKQKQLIAVCGRMYKLYLLTLEPNSIELQTTDHTIQWIQNMFYTVVDIDAMQIQRTTRQQATTRKIWNAIWATTAAATEN